MSRWEIRNYRGDGSWWVVERRDDLTRIVTTYDESGAVVSTRPYTAEEDAEADRRLALSARLDDHEARIVRIESHLWPADPDPEPGEPIIAPTWEDYNGVWPNGTLLSDGGKVWRNVSGVPLTTRPSDFPGDASAWAHLFVEVVAPDPEPTTPEGYVGPWDPQAAYAVGDVVDKDGFYFRCLVAHGAERQGTWAPGVAPTIWTNIGPVT